MNTPAPPELPSSGDLICRELTLPELVAEVYDEAPAAEDRARLLQPLMAALGMLSIAGVADGVFSWLRLASARPEPGIVREALTRVRSSHVLALAEQAQQVDPEVINGLSRVLQSSPSLGATAAAAVLLAVLARHAARVSGAL